MDSPARALSASFAEQFALSDLVLTWGPDGGYGHADHRMVSALATQAVQAMPAATRPKLLYVGIPNGTLPPLPQMASWATTDPALLTETIAYTASDLAAATTALGDDVDLAMYWDAGHGANEDPDAFVAWIGKITGYSA